MTLYSLHPAASFTYFASVLIPVMFCPNPVLQVTAVFFSFCFLCTHRPLMQNISDIAFYLSLFLLIAVTNPIFSHNGETELFFLNGNAVTLEAVLCGASISASVIAVIVWCRTLSLVLTSDKIIYLFGSFTPKTALIISITLRFIPLFTKQYKKTAAIQKTLGLYSSSSITDRLYSSIKIMSSMITWSLENAVEISSSMKSRGYGKRNRTSFSLFRFSLTDKVFIVSVLALFTVTASAIAVGSLSFSYYPSISSLDLSAFSVLAYFSYFVLSCVPFILEVKEAVKWKYYLLKI